MLSNDSEHFNNSKLRGLQGHRRSRPRGIPATRGRLGATDERASGPHACPLQADERHQGRRPGTLSDFDLRSLLQALHGQDVRFVVIGGVAVGAHGYVRATMDLDLVPDPDPENLERLITALDSLQATLPTVGGRPFDPSGDARAIRRGGNVTADTKFGGLDIVQLAQGVPGYSQLARDAVESELLGVSVQVCSLNRLREMKQAQGRAQDQADLENLPEG